MDIWNWLILPAAGLVAGLIDSIAGGGGLITVPLLSLLIGPGAFAIGTNKIAAVVSSLAALIVYLRAGHVRLSGNLLFALVTGLSSILGALASPFVPGEVYRWILVAIAPAILWIVFHKDLWIRHEIEGYPDHLAHSSRSRRTTLLFLGCAVGCGLYDGLAGPGGGTLMFLSLLLVAKIPLLQAMGTAKLANLASASISLSTYATTGHVIWMRGFSLAFGIAFGAAIGASLASLGPSSSAWYRNTPRLTRLALLIVASLLALRLALQ